MNIEGLDVASAYEYKEMTSHLYDAKGSLDCAQILEYILWDLLLISNQHPLPIEVASLADMAVGLLAGC